MSLFYLQPFNNLKISIYVELKLPWHVLQNYLLIFPISPFPLFLALWLSHTDPIFCLFQNTSFIWICTTMFLVCWKFQPMSNFYLDYSYSFLMYQTRIYFFQKKFFLYFQMEKEVKFCQVTLIYTLYKHELCLSWHSLCSILNV